MFGRTRMFTFRGTHAKTFSVETNLENFYHQMRDRGYVPVAGTEDVVYTGGEGEHSLDFLLKIVGKECDRPWDIRYVTNDGGIEWFTTEETPSRQS